MKISDKIFREIPKSKYLQMLPNFQGRRTQQFTTIVLTIVALSVFGLFAINPTISTIVKLKKELSDDQFVDQQLKQKISSLSSLQRQYSNLQNDIPFILNAMPQNSDSPLLLAQIQSVAQATNIHIKNLQNFQVELVKLTNINQQYYSYSFTVSGEGNYESISKFLSSLTTMQRIIGVEALSLNQSEDKTGLLQFNLRGTTFYKK